MRPGGRFAVSDVVADPDIDEATRRDLALWTGCIAGALTINHYRSLLEEAGLGSIEILQTHRVHAHAGSAIIRAAKAG
jgi:arsenite methyltransferase